MLKKENIRKIQPVDNGPDRFIVRVSNMKKTHTNKKNKPEAIVSHNYCFVNGNHCNCSTFTYNSCIYSKLQWCNHLVVAKIAMLVNCYQTESIEQSKYREYCRRCFL